MAEKKKQHYVPKLLLRHFSIDDKKKNINVFNADTRFYKQNCPLKNQGQEDYFYGEDGIIEKELEQLETAAAPIIAEIIKHKQIPKKDTEKYGILFFFSLLLTYRTKSSAEHLNEVVNKTFQEITKLDERFSEFKDKGINIELKNAAAHSLSVISEAILGAYDLKLTLLVNTTNKKFITSDNPSVKYNQFLEKRNHLGGHLGIFTKGLQIFFPLSPDVMLVYYDKWAYKFGNKKDTVIFLNNDSDIDQLNLLQIANCHKIIFSDNNIKEFYLNKIAEQVQKIRSRDLTKMYEINKRFIDSEGLEHIQFTQHSDDRKINLELTFIKQPQSAKSHNLSDYVVQLRDERMRNYKR